MLLLEVVALLFTYKYKCYYFVNTSLRCYTHQSQTKCGKLGLLAGRMDEYHRYEQQGCVNSEHVKIR
ncbi:MAG: hypothetical protein ACJAYN_002085 [Bermanella sp.]|jgi:hypothetical protein